MLIVFVVWVAVWEAPSFMFPYELNQGILLSDDSVWPAAWKQLSVLPMRQDCWFHLTLERTTWCALICSSPWNNQHLKPSVHTNSLSRKHWPRATWFTPMYQNHITVPPRTGHHPWVYTSFKTLLMFQQTPFSKIYRKCHMEYVFLKLLSVSSKPPMK